MTFPHITMPRMPAVFQAVLLCLLLMAPSAHAGNEKTIALVMKALSNPFFSRMESGAKAFARQEGIPLEIFGVDRETDIDHQIDIMENLISRGYGAIVIAPADSRRLVPVCKKAVAGNIRVINVDNPLDAGEMAKSGFSIPFVGPDNFQGAGQVGNYIHQRLSGKGRAMIIEGIRGVQNAEDRKNGLIQALSKSPGIQIVSLESANWHMDEAMSLIMKTVRQPDSVDAILCANDQMALGALKALDMLDFKKKIWVTGYDNTEGLRYEMTQGRIHATVEQHPEVMGQTGVMLAWNALKGQKIPDKTITPVDLVTFESMNKKLHLSISSLSNPFFSSLVQGALSMSKIFGFQTVVFDAENNDARQLTDMVGSIRTGLDLLIINPTHSESIVSGIELANEKHIPVITVDRKASDADILCHVESDNVGGGRIAASAMIRYLKGNGRIIEMEGIPAASVSHERGMGFNAMIQRHPDIRIVAREVGNFDREDARQAMQRLLQKSIRFDAVFAHNDVMILGVLDALTDAGIDPSTRVLIGFDGIPEVLDQIKQGRLTATVGQKPEVMGSLALQQAARFFRGDDVSSSILVNLELIEKP